MSFPDSDRIRDIEAKKMESPEFDEAPSYDRHAHDLSCPLNRWKHPWRLSECTCGGGMTKDDLDDGNRKGE